LVFVTLAYPQVRDASVQEKVIANYPITSGDSPRPIQVSPLGGVLLRETRGFDVTYTLSDASNTSVTSEVLSASENVEPRAWLSQDGGKLSYRFQEGGRLRLDLIDVRTGQRITLRDPNKDIGTASVSARDGRIVFQAREARSLPKVYLAKADGSGGKFITEGMGETWSPNGEWIAIKQPRDVRDFKPSPKSGEPWAENAKWIYGIYSPSGRLLLKLNEFENPINFLWSPTSDRALIWAGGFRIVSLSTKRGSVAIESVSSIRADTSALSAVDFPSWSPDGKAITYVRQIMDPTGHFTEKEEVWIRNVKNNAKMKIYEVSHPSVVMDLVWSQNGTVLLQKDDGTQSPNVSVVELSSNGKSIRIRK
jgi:Tol biopolymer transport system component